MLFKEDIALREKRKLRKSILVAVLSAAMTTVSFAGPAWTAKTTVTAAETTSVEVVHTTVTEGFDWGPAITKVVLHIGKNLDSKAELLKDTFKVNVVKKDPFKKTTTLEGKREVIAAYVSDASGNKAETGECVTIEMVVGPKVSIGSPFENDNSHSVTHSVFTDCEYTINQEKAFKAADDSTVENISSMPTSYDEKNSIKLLCDDFDSSGQFTYKDSKYGDIKLQYASYSPAKDDKKNPLIIWLHGAGEGGTDPRVALLGNKVVNLASESIQKYFDGAYVLVPQCGTMWMDDGTGEYTPDGTSMYTEALMECIKNYVNNNSDIDFDRIYIGGCSNGGYMTLEMITTYPEYFVAAFPTCEAYKDVWLPDEKVNAIKDMPIWFTHAKDDTVVPINVQAEGSSFSEPKFEKDKDGNYILANDYSTKAVERLRAAGGKNIYLSLFENVTDQTGKYFKEDGISPYHYNGHFVWIYVLNNKGVQNIDGKDVTLMEWLASQKRTGESLGNQDVQKLEKTVITVAKSEYVVKKGKTVTIKASVKNAGGQKVTYKSKDKKIATVNTKGVVRGVKKGSTTIVIQCNGVTKRVKVTVK